MSQTIDIKELFKAGAHFGHKTSRWHPKMEPYIHSARGGIHIIDLVKTADKLAPALEAISAMAAKQRDILIIGTKQQADESIKAAAEASGMPYLTNRWMGGLLTNFKTFSQRIKHLKELEEKMASGELGQRYSKLEVQRFQEEIDDLNETFGGIKDMDGLPGMVFIVDIVREDTALSEAKKLKIPVVAMVDTNADPSSVEYPIPCNDDAIKSIALLMEYVTQAVAEGKARAGKQPVAKTEPAATPAATKKAAASTPTAPKKVKKVAKKTVAKKTTPRKVTNKKTAPKKVAKKTVAKKTTAKKATSKKTATKKTKKMTKGSKK